MTGALAENQDNIAEIFIVSRRSKKRGRSRFVSGPEDRWQAADRLRRQEDRPTPST